MKTCHSYYQQVTTSSARTVALSKAFHFDVATLASDVAGGRYFCFEHQGGCDILQLLRRVDCVFEGLVSEEATWPLYGFNMCNMCNSAASRQCIHQFFNQGDTGRGWDFVRLPAMFPTSSVWVFRIEVFFVLVCFREIYMTPLRTEIPYRSLPAIVFQLRIRYFCAPFTVWHRWVMRWPRSRGMEGSLHGWDRGV